MKTKRRYKENYSIAMQNKHSSAKNMTIIKALA